MNTDLDHFMSEWSAVDYLTGKHITVSQASGFISGVACGVNRFGQLILKDDQGIRHYLSSGDTSLQPGKS